MGVAISSAQDAANQAFEKALGAVVLIRDALEDLSPRLITAARALRLVRRAAAPNQGDTDDDDDGSESGTDTSPGDDAKPAQLELILSSTDEQLRVAQSLVDRVRRAVRQSSLTTADQDALHAVAEDSSKVWQQNGVERTSCGLCFPQYLSTEEAV